MNGRSGRPVRRLGGSVPSVSSAGSPPGGLYSPPGSGQPRGFKKAGGSLGKASSETPADKLAAADPKGGPVRRKTARVEAVEFLFRVLSDLSDTSGRGWMGHGKAVESASAAEQHVRPREIVEEVVRRAHREFGPLAESVLASWGIIETIQIGELLFELVASGELRAAPEESAEDFRDVLDLRAALAAGYKIAGLTSDRPRR